MALSSTLANFIDRLSILGSFNQQNKVNYALIPSSDILLENRIKDLDIKGLWDFLKANLNRNSVNLFLPVNYLGKLKYQEYKLQSKDLLKGVDILRFIDNFYTQPIEGGRYEQINQLMSSLEGNYKQKTIIAGFDLKNNNTLILKLESVIISELQQLPLEILYESVRNLSLKDVINLCKSSPYFRRICEDDYIMKPIVDQVDIVNMRPGTLEKFGFNTINYLLKYRYDELKDITNARFFDRYTHEQTSALAALFTSAAEKGYINIVKNLLDEPTISKNGAIIVASDRGKKDIVRLLLPYIKNLKYLSDAIKKATFNNYPETLKILLNYLSINNIKIPTDFGLLINFGVSPSLPQVTTGMFRGYMDTGITNLLSIAASKGNLETLIILLSLLPLYDMNKKQIDIELILRNAIFSDQLESIKLILNDPIIYNTIKKLGDEYIKRLINLYYTPFYYNRQITKLFMPFFINKTDLFYLCVIYNFTDLAIEYAPLSDINPENMYLYKGREIDPISRRKFIELLSENPDIDILDIELLKMPFLNGNNELTNFILTNPKFSSVITPLIYSEVELIYHSLKRALPDYIYPRDYHNLIKVHRTTNSDNPEDILGAPIEKFREEDKNKFIVKFIREEDEGEEESPEFIENSKTIYNNVLNKYIDDKKEFYYFGFFDINYGGLLARIPFSDSVSPRMAPLELNINTFEFAAGGPNLNYDHIIWRQFNDATIINRNFNNIPLDFEKFNYEFNHRVTGYSLGWTKRQLRDAIINLFGYVWNKNYVRNVPKTLKPNYKHLGIQVRKNKVLNLNLIVYYNKLCKFRFYYRYFFGVYDFWDWSDIKTRRYYDNSFIRWIAEHIYFISNFNEYNLEYQEAYDALLDRIIVRAKLGQERVRPIIYDNAREFYAKMAF